MIEKTQEVVSAALELLNKTQEALARFVENHRNPNADNTVCELLGLHDTAAALKIRTDLYNLSHLSDAQKKEGDGSPAKRFELLMSHLESRFPHPKPFSSVCVPEIHYLEAIDKLLYPSTPPAADDAQKKGGDVESAIAGLVDALAASKGWLRGYADSVIRDAIDRQPKPPAAAEAPAVPDNEEIEAIIACLGDDAQSIRDETGNAEDERADNMDRAADLLRALATPSAAEAPAVTEFNVGRFVLSEDDCRAEGLDFRAYERGVSDAAVAFARNKK